MKTLQTIKMQNLVTLLLAAVCVVGVVIPLAAQDSATVETTADATIILTGEVSFSATGDILVGGYIIAPAGAFNPSMLQPGDVVIVIGLLLPDGITVQAQEFEFFEEPEVTPEATPEMTPEATSEATPEVTPEVTEEPATCGNPAHPVAARIAEEFGVSSAEVMAMHCQGNGFGNIVRAFLLAETGGGAAQDFLDRHHSGEGWGQIMRESDVNPSSFAPGRAIGKDKNAEATEESGTTLSQQNTNANGGGNGRGNGNGNSGGNGSNPGNNGNGNAGNPGNGGGNGNAGGNDNGNAGNGGGNGNAGGNGKGKGR